MVVNVSKKMTMADQIRSMSDEELAQYLTSVYMCGRDYAITGRDSGDLLLVYCQFLKTLGGFVQE